MQNIYTQHQQIYIVYFIWNFCFVLHRTGAVPAAAVSSPAKAAPAAARGAAAVAAKPPRLELEGGRKWVIEHQVRSGACAVPP